MRLSVTPFLSVCLSVFVIPFICYNPLINPLTPNDPYRGRTAPLTSKSCILYIYSTNIDTEYFKHDIYSPFFFSSKCSLFHNSNVFSSCIIHILCTGCAKIKKKLFRRQKFNCKRLGADKTGKWSNRLTLAHAYCIKFFI